MQLYHDGPRHSLIQNASPQTDGLPTHPDCLLAFLIHRPRHRAKRNRGTAANRKR